MNNPNNLPQIILITGNMASRKSTVSQALAERLPRSVHLRGNVFRRDSARAKTGYPDRESVIAFDRILREETPRTGYWLDNSDLSVEETVERLYSYVQQIK